MISKSQDFLKGKTKESFVAELVAKFPPAVTHAYIFGSFYSDKFNSKSDLDLIFIVDDKTASSVSFTERPILFKSFVMSVDAPIDLLVYSKAEFEKLRVESSPFWRNVQASLVKIFIKKDA